MRTDNWRTLPPFIVQHSSLRIPDWPTILPDPPFSLFPFPHMPHLVLARRAVAALFVSVLLAGGAPSAQAAAATPVVESSLPNGMHILVKTDRRAPVVVCMVWYRVGSMDEVNGTTG